MQGLRGGLEEGVCKPRLQELRKVPEKAWKGKKRPSGLTVGSVQLWQIAEQERLFLSRKLEVRGDLNAVSQRVNGEPG